MPLLTALGLALGLAFTGCRSDGIEKPAEPSGGSSGSNAGSGGSSRGGNSGGNAAAGQAGPGNSGGSGGQAGAPQAGAGGAPGAGGESGEDAGAPTEAGPATPPESSTPGTTDLSMFKYSKVIGLDTTGGGAGVSADVPGYPVAVQLDATNFDFAQAQPAGQDVRFGTADNKPLPYAIELWDAAAQKAALWVRVDLKGNDNTQSITLHWGNPKATSAADSKAVFSKEAGFLGVYHLDQDGNTTPGGYQDASWNEVNGTGILLSPGSAVPARVGLGTRFVNPQGGASGKIQWIEVTGEKVLQDFGTRTHPISVSVWAYAETWDGYYQTIISKGDGSYSLQEDYQNRTEVCMSPTSGRYHQCAITGAPPTKRWMHYMIMRKNGPYASNNLVLYINGQRAAGTTAGGGHVDLPFGIANQSLRGRERDKKGFNGVLDEVRVMPVERDANWAKLDYESQREGSTFLKFGETTTKP